MTQKYYAGIKILGPNVCEIKSGFVQARQIY